MTPWIVFDLETEGLDPSEDRILEIAAIAVDPKTLAELDRFQCLVMPSGGVTASKFILAMHTKSGLLQALGSEGGWDTAVADHMLHDWLRKFGTERLSLCGNSVHFDLGFVTACLPESRERLSHRIVDVSSLILLDKAWELDSLGASPSIAHRAMADCEMSLASLRAFREALSEVGAYIKAELVEV